MKTVPRIGVLLAFAWVSAFVPAPAEARVITIADQNARTFTDPLWQSLGLTHTRLNVAWDIATGVPDTRTVAALDATQAAGVNVLVTWTPSGNRLPTEAGFTDAFLAFRRRWPKIREFATWNEPNLRGMQTNDNPRLVARYYTAMKARCLGCTVLAPELVDFPSAPTWARRFERAVGRRNIAWGLHNYRDANRFGPLRKSVTAAMLRAVKGPIWLTETGGVVRFGQTLSFDERRAGRATARVFSLARLNPKRISRIYLYHWRAPSREYLWDSGLLSYEGQPRASFWILADRLGKTEAAERALAARNVTPPAPPGTPDATPADEPSRSPLLCLLFARECD
ncbi:MAG: glycosyl hydrolase [Actinomycetota bacterium]|nr:glycosyl hydrolase [Actinomycetota bacterium]